MEIDPETRARVFRERFGAHGLARFGLAHLHGMLTWPRAAKIMIEGDDPVHFSAREIQAFRHHRNGRIRYIAQLALDGVQDFEQRTGAPSALGHNPPHYVLFGYRSSLHAMASIRPAQQQDMKTPGPRKTLLMACAVIAAAAQAAAHGADFSTDGDFSIGGNVAITSDYIYRGVSESDHPALQTDVHANTGGSFLGAWASTRDRDLDPGAPGELEIYFGHRFNLSSAWSATVSARSHYFVRSSQTSADYQEVSASVAWLDRFTFTLATVPNAVRWYQYVRLGRSPAWVADTSGQWLIGEHLFVTGAAGYYYSTALGAGEQSAAGYAYGDVGLAFEERQWRVEVGYFLAQNRAQELFPYPPANRRVAGTVSWRF